MVPFKRAHYRAGRVSHHIGGIKIFKAYAERNLDARSYQTSGIALQHRLPLPLLEKKNRAVQEAAEHPNLRAHCTA